MYHARQRRFLSPFPFSLFPFPFVPFSFLLFLGSFHVSCQDERVVDDDDDVGLSDCAIRLKDDDRVAQVRMIEVSCTWGMMYHIVSGTICFINGTIISCQV